MSDARKLGAILSALLLATLLAFTVFGIPEHPMPGNPATQPSFMSALANRTVNISGEVVDSEGWRIVSDFVVIAVNETGEQTAPRHTDMGTFSIAIQVPTFARDNDTITVRVLSPDQATLYANSTVALSNLNHTSSYSLQITVANPPPNYNGLLLVVLFLIFACILAGYILFTKWLVAQAVLRKANDIMIKRQGLENAGIENEGDAEEDPDENEEDERSV